METVDDLFIFVINKPTGSVKWVNSSAEEYHM